MAASVDDDKAAAASTARGDMMVAVARVQNERAAKSALYGGRLWVCIVPRALQVYEKGDRGALLRGRLMKSLLE